MRNLPLKRLSATRTLALFMFALALAALALFPLVRPAQAHAATPVMVTNAGDAGPGTLRWALEQVKSGNGSRIEFDTTTMGTSEIIIESELPAIESAVEIVGPVGDVTVRKDLDTELLDGWRHLRIKGGQAEFDVSISNVIFDGPGEPDHQPLKENGGIFVSDTYKGTLTLTGCALINNVNKLGRDAIISGMARGGAVNVLSEKAELHMEDCTLEGNYALSYGGSVYSASPVFAKECSFSNNQSYGDNPGGGALGVGVTNDNDPNDPELYGGKVELTQCQVLNNYSDLGSGGVRSSKLTMTGCTVSGNRATRSSSGGKGGGVNADELVMTGCTVSNNHSNGSGAGIYASVSAEITGSIVSMNSSSNGEAGGAFIAGSGVVKSSKFVGNESRMGVGGGIAVFGQTGQTPPTLEVVDSTIEGNTSKGAGGGIYAYDTRLVLTNTVVSKNESSSREGGGGIYGDEDASLSMTGGAIVGNKADGYIPGTTILDASGGGVLLEKGKAVLKGCLVADNVAGVEGGGLAAPDVALTNCTVSGNTVDKKGGGIFSQTVELVNCTVSGNVSGAGTAPGITGGGVLADALTMNGSIVAGNYDAADKSSELVVGGKLDNGDGTVADSHGGKKNIVGVPAAGLGTIMETQKNARGLEVGALKADGSTAVIMLTPDGPAQDVVAQGDYDPIPDVDQRGVRRPTGPLADIGAVEVSGLNLTYSVEQNFDIYRGGDQSLTGKADAPLCSAMGVEVGGTTLEPGTHYTLTEGSTVVTLTPAYLKTLKSGKYNVVVSYTNGSATLPLTVELPQPKPDPDDPTDPVNPKDPTNPVEPTKPTDPTQPAKSVDSSQSAKSAVLARMGDDAVPFGVALALAAAAAVALGVARRRLG